MRRRPGRRLVAAVLVAVVAVVVVFVLVRRSDDEVDPRAGSVALATEPGLFDFDQLPDTYRIDYRVEGFGGDVIITNADRLLVRRPFASRLESYAGPVVDGEPTSTQISDLGAVRVVDDDGERAVVAAAPAPGVSDVRVARSLDDALDDGLFELGERRRVAGRECQVLRTAVGFETADLAPPSSDTDFAETCVDADGLVLEELLVADGEPLLRRVATDVEVGVDLDDELFETGEPSVPTDQGGGFFAEIETDSRPPGATFYDPGDGPDGLERFGRYAVVPPQAENFTDIERRGQRLTFVSDVFTDGSDLVVLDQGGTLGNVDPFPGLVGVDVDEDLGIDGAERVVLTYGRGGPIVIVTFDDGRFLRARSTGEPDVLIDLLASLEPVEGGELELVDPPG